MDTIHDKSTRPIPPQISFDWTPKAGDFTMNVGGNVYPWAVDEPQDGAPDQPDIFYTHTEVELTFTASVHVEAGVSIIEYHWNFGDGTEGYGPVIQHTYRSPSPQTRATLCVTDNFRRKVCVGQQLLLEAGQKVVLAQTITVER